MKISLSPSEYVLNGDSYSWWLTRIKPRKNNPFELVESDSLGYYPSIDGVLRSIPKKTLARDDIGDLKQLIRAVNEMNETIKAVGALIIERYGDAIER